MNNIFSKTVLIATLCTAVCVPLSPVGEVSRGAALAAALSLDPDEAATLAIVREEEKLARDVYLRMEEIWGMAVFTLIAEAEQAHMDAIKRMLDKYGLPDPALGMGIGEFANAEIQALYDDWLLDGSRSKANALLVGVSIEQWDIGELTAAIGESDNSDLDQVYGNLRSGSESHLEAFLAHFE